MKGLERILRQREWQLDEMRQKLISLEDLARNLNERLATVDENSELEWNAEATYSDAFGSLDLHDFAASRRGRLQHSLRNVKQEMRDAMREIEAALLEISALKALQSIREERVNVNRRTLDGSKDQRKSRAV